MVSRVAGQRRTRLVSTATPGVREQHGLTADGVRRQLYVRDGSGNPIGVSMRELIDLKMGATIARADLHISRTGDGELLLTSRQDGMIRMLVADSNVPRTPTGR